MSNGNGDIKVAVAIHRDKSSQYAMKWAIDHLLDKGKHVTLLHIKSSASSIPHMSGQSNFSFYESKEDVLKVLQSQNDSELKELFLPFRCFCTRKNIQTDEVMIEDNDIVKALCNYVKENTIDNLVIGATLRTRLKSRFKSAIDVPGGVSKGAPDFCTVYIINKGKVSSVRKSTSLPPRSVLTQSKFTTPAPVIYSARNININGAKGSTADRSLRTSRNQTDGNDTIKSPFTRNRAAGKSLNDVSMSGLDISFVSTNRPITDRFVSSFSDSQDMNFVSRLPRLPHSTDRDSSFNADFSGRSFDANHNHGVTSQTSLENDGKSWASSPMMDDTEAEIRRLKQELKQTINMYGNACKEAITAKQQTAEFNQWKVDKQQKVKEATLAQEAALEIAAREQAKCKAAIEAAEAAQRIAALESQKRKNAEWKALKEEKEKNKVLDELSNNDVRYRRYSIEEIEAATENFSKDRKIGEGGYGPVYKSYLDHTPVAIKVLHPDATQGQSQFQQEVEVLSCIRHPNMVLLLGACPDFGCLVYEYMANGSLDDCLFWPGNRPVLSWQIRFRIAAEIATGLLFLHQAKPEPLVHRDLKPGNILLDSNYVSKISDVGLARLVPPSVADTVTQYRMTSAAGTFCYIDPEYQQTGMLGTKSDVYSLGVMLLQIISARSPMGLTHHIGRAIERGTFTEMLDPAIQNWPIDEALSFAKLALRCTELRRKDRPDLGKEVLPELNRLRSIAEDSMLNMMNL